MAFFYYKEIQKKCFLENYRFCEKSGNDANSMGGSCSLRYYDAVCMKIDV